MGGERAIRLALTTGLCIATLGLAPSLAAADTHYASPTGANPSCTKNFPCSLEMALAAAKDGDAVSLLGGNYGIPFAGITIDEDIEIGGEPGGGVPVLLTTVVANVQVNPGVDARLHDLRIEGETGLVLGSAVAERVFVSTGYSDYSVCELEPGATMRDSVCWGHPDESEIEGTKHALEVTASGEGADDPVILRNVTAVTTAKTGNAIYAFGAFGGKLTVDAKNVIARSRTAIDVVARIEGGGNPESHVLIANSNFGTFEDGGTTSTAVVLEPGTNGNQVAPPLFVNGQDGDFHQLPESPTIDAGVSDSLVGPKDIDGLDRAQAGCFGALATPDVGAYERLPTGPCPPPPPEPPKPPEPRKPVFRIVSLHLNKKTGAGRLRVEVPGAGTVSLTGSGVKLVRRTAPAGGGVVSLPIQAWVITRVRLAKFGKTRVRLVVTFEGRSGGFEAWKKGVLLRKSKPKHRKSKPKHRKSKGKHRRGKRR